MVMSARYHEMRPFAAPQVRLTELRFPKWTRLKLRNVVSEQTPATSVRNREEAMSVKDAILNTQPTSYWPLDDYDVPSCQDEMGLHNASLPAQGVTLAVIPFGAAQAP